LLTLFAALPVMIALLRRDMLPLIVIRKGYHLLAVVLFVPGILADPDMLSIALAVGKSVYTIRYSALVAVFPSEPSDLGTAGTNSVLRCMSTC
jgi:hypothetical protein